MADAQSHVAIQPIDSPEEEQQEQQEEEQEEGEEQEQEQERPEDDEMLLPEVPAEGNLKFNTGPIFVYCTCRARPLPMPRKLTKCSRTDT